MQMALLPKTLIWQKTVHAGGSSSAGAVVSAYPEFALETPGQSLDLDEEVVISPEG